MLEKGDADIARNLSPQDLDALASQQGRQDHRHAQGHGLLHQPEPEEPEPGQARSA
jgi:hypothetical protein